MVFPNHTWAAMDLTEEELTEIGFSRGGARSFATECRAMRAARGIFDRPPEAITVASKGQQRTVTVATFPSTDTTGVKGCGVRPIPENPLARGTLATLSDFQCHYRNDYSAAKADKAKPATDDKQAAAAKAALQADAKDAEEKKAADAKAEGSSAEEEAAKEAAFNTAEAFSEREFIAVTRSRRRG